jgi:DNA repair protein RadC
MDLIESTTSARPKRKTSPDLVLPRQKPIDGTYNLYVKTGDAFERAPDKLVIECAQQLVESDFRVGATKVTSIAQVLDFLTLHIGSRDEEVFAVMLLTQDRRFIAYEELSHGTVVTTAVELRSVMETVVRSRASCVIAAHNHPQGGCEPSQADISLTSRLYRALKMIDVELLDHVIIGAQVFSFYSRGCLREPWLALHAQA